MKGSFKMSLKLCLLIGLSFHINAKNFDLSVIETPLSGPPPPRNVFHKLSSGVNHMFNMLRNCSSAEEKLKFTETAKNLSLTADKNELLMRTVLNYTIEIKEQQSSSAKSLNELKEKLGNVVSLINELSNFTKSLSKKIDSLDTLQNSSATNVGSRRDTLTKTVARTIEQICHPLPENATSEVAASREANAHTFEVKLEMIPGIEDILWPQDCQALHRVNIRQSGVRFIHPFALHRDKAVAVYCDEDTEGGGWTVIQKRVKSTDRENFTRPWKDYVQGFGNPKGEFWVGLNAIHALTTSSSKKLRIVMEDYQGEERFAEYGIFMVAGPGRNYEITVENYNGTAGDALSYHNGKMFTTIDSDNDAAKTNNCAEYYKGGWWYGKCHRANLNGFPREGYTTYHDGIVWNTWEGHEAHSLKTVVMMVKNNE